MTQPTKIRTATTTTLKEAKVSTDLTAWTELVDRVEANSGVAIVPMSLLRKLEGAERLGVHVLKSIESRLATLGLGHMPDSLPNRQDQETILYRYGTPASDVISAVRNGLATANAVRSTYQALHRVNVAPTPTEVVHRETLEDNLSTAAKAVLDLLEPSSRTALIDEIR